MLWQVKVLPDPLFISSLYLGVRIMRLFALILVSLLPSLASAQTRLSGIVYAGQTRTVPAGNYFVDTRILVYGGGKIIFSPGVKIEVRAAQQWLAVIGEADFAGTQAQPITITTLSSLGIPGNIQSNSNTATPAKLTMRYTNYASHAQHLIFAKNTSLLVDNCRFVSTSTSTTKAIFRAYSNSFGTVSNSILDLSDNIGFGFDVGLSPTIVDSTGIDLINVAVLNSAQPINIQKIAPVAVLNGSID
jgi:hypothetical protein